MLKACIDTNVWISGVIFSGKPAEVVTAAFNNRILQCADLYEPTGTVKVIPDGHTDNLVLETAVLGRVKYLVTGDREHLLPLKVFRSVKILDPAQFVLVLKN